LSVTHRRRVPAPPERVWQYFADPALLGRWFADAGPLSPGAPFRFEFGDGDFFVGQLRHWEPPRSLELSWKFLSIGAAYVVTIALNGMSDETDVVVEDRGARSPEEASALFQGWADFLGALERCVRTGSNARYRWTPSFTAEAVVGGSHVDPCASLAWWKQTFPGVDLTLDRADGDAVATITDPAWDGVRSEARAHAQSDQSDTIIRIVHTGFDALPEHRQLPERRRYATIWCDALAAVERVAVRQAVIMGGRT